MEEPKNIKSSPIEEDEFTETNIDDLCGDLESLSF
jgi:hypothetical protein